MKLLTLIFILVFGLSVFSQTPTAESKLNNKDVVEMVAAGLPDSVVISKIKVSEVAFETDIPALKLLQQAKVSDAILSAMIEKAAEKPPEKKPVVGTWDSPEHGTISELKNAKTVYLYTKDIKGREIIVRELSRITELKIVENREKSDFALNFVSGSSNTGASVIGSTVTSNSVFIGELYAITLGEIDAQNRRHQRIVWQTRKKQAYSAGITLNRHPATNAINQFIKDFKEMRGEK